MRLAELYKKEIIPRLKEQFAYSSALAVPKLEKVTVNVGVGRHSKDKKYIESVVDDIRVMTGQNPVLTKSKKSVSAFKVREGDTVGVTVLLRGQRMYDFVEKLINATLPRVRDFRGISPEKVDNNGNLTIGFKEHIAFPEIKVDHVDQTHGLEVSITTTADDKKQGLELLKLLGFPFSKK
ncbi:MAG: 50S ribosomal protein L5 [bacterium]